MEFTKEHTNLAKFVAICLMIMHHLFFSIEDLAHFVRILFLFLFRKKN